MPQGLKPDLLLITSYGLKPVPFMNKVFRRLFRPERVVESHALISGGVGYRSQPPAPVWSLSSASTLSRKVDQPVALLNSSGT